jgi:enterochelin esterase-like enzyme
MGGGVAPTEGSGMPAAATRALDHLRANHLAIWVAGAATIIVAISAGLIGTYHYIDNYWLYRGFAPPQDPAFVAKGTFAQLTVTSAALGGRQQPVNVYLPPGYATHPADRYPVIYLLHGSPGVPASYFRAGRLGVLEDILVRKNLIRPVILVAPFGSTGVFTDKEWANGVRPHEGWETFLARDVVRAVDAQYRTIRAGWARALVGLSEGGYGALNIGIHHPGEFHVLESWSGYMRADNIASIFGRKKALLRWNSPALTLPAAAPALRAAKTFVWFYSGSVDPLLAQNQQFARELARYRISSHFFVHRGGHDWALWRGEAANALLAAGKHLHPIVSLVSAGHVPGTGQPVARHTSGSAGVRSRHA